MGYNAIVKCNCYKEGKIAQPPFVEYLYEDEDGGLHLDMDDNYTENRDKYSSMDSEFDTWMHTACEHEDMDFCYERLSNNSGMAAFREIVSQRGGIDRFPVLTNGLPVSNSGSLSAEFAGHLYKELIDLEADRTKESQMVLKELSINTVVQKVNDNLRYVFAWSGYNRLNFGIDLNGFYIRRNRQFLGWKYSGEVFRSDRFSQSPGPDGYWLFTDFKSGRKCKSTMRIFPEMAEDPDGVFEFMVTREQKTIGEEYAYIIKPLKKLAKASAHTGNPILWL